MRLDHLLSKGYQRRLGKRSSRGATVRRREAASLTAGGTKCRSCSDDVILLGFQRRKPECTLKIAYQTQICKRETFYRGEPRNQRQKMSTDQNRIQIKKMFCTRINFIEKRKSKDESSEKIRGSLQKGNSSKSEELQVAKQLVQFVADELV